MTSTVVSRNGCKTAGSRTTKEPRKTGQRERFRTVWTMYCAVVHGITMSVMLEHQAGTSTPAMCAIRPTGSASLVPNERGNSTMLTRRLILPALITPVLARFAIGRAEARTKAPDNAYLYIIWPNDGERIKGGCWVRFGLRNMGVTHAGDSTANMGHHHLLIDVEE